MSRLRLLWSWLLVLVFPSSHLAPEPLPIAGAPRWHLRLPGASRVGT